MKRPSFDFEASAGARQSQDRNENPYRCRVPGCHIPAGINDGGSQRICGFHFGLTDSQQASTVRKMRAHPVLLEALTISDGISAAAMRNLGQQLVDAGFPELAPKVIEMNHEGYGRHGAGLSVTRDEAEYPKLYRQRLRALAATL